MAFDIRNTGFELPDGWKLVRLGDIAKINSKTLTKKSSLTDIRYIDISSTSTGKFEEPTCMKIENAPSRAKRILVNNDIIISTVRPNLKQFAFVENASSNLIASTGFCVISAENEKLAWYLYALITSDMFTAYLIAVADGAAYPAFNPIEIEDAIIALPPEKYLDSVVDITRAIHKKIQLNTQTNQTLEQIAQAIYKSWFVDYEPTRAKAAVLAAGGSQQEAETAAMTAISGKTAAALAALKQHDPARYQQLADLAAAFPTALIPTDDFGEIPAGWEVKYLKDVCKIVYGKGLPTSKLQEKGFPVFGGNGVIGYYKDYLYKEPKTLISCRGAASGKVIYSLPYSFVTNNSLVIENKGSGLESFYIYESLRLQNLADLASGSAQPQITISNMNPVRILIPSNKVCNFYSEKIKSIYEKMYEINKESELLSNLRDIILPKLLNGELKQE